MNRLRTNNEPGADTRYQVRAVLSFVSHSLLALSEDGEMTKESMLGAGLIIDLCIDALREADEEGDI